MGECVAGLGELAVVGVRDGVMGVGLLGGWARLRDRGVGVGVGGMGMWIGVWVDLFPLFCV